MILRFKKKIIIITFDMHYYAAFWSVLEVIFRVLGISETLLSKLAGYFVVRLVLPVCSIDVNIACWEWLYLIASALIGCYVAVSVSEGEGH